MRTWRRACRVCRQEPTWTPNPNATASIFKKHTLYSHCDPKISSPSTQNSKQIQCLKWKKRTKRVKNKNKKKEERNNRRTVEAGGQLDDKPQSEGEAEHERPIPAPLRQRHLRQRPSYHRQHHIYNQSVFCKSKFQRDCNKRSRQTTRRTTDRGSRLQTEREACETLEYGGSGDTHRGRP